MELVIADEVQKDTREEATRSGSTPRQWLLTTEGDDGFGLRVVRSEYQSGENAFATPRHHHGFQQIRWAQTGSLNFAPKQDIEQGDIAYFPRGAFYGPQRRDHGVGLTIQFGFGVEMLGGKNASQVYREGVRRLRERGTIEDGVYIDLDPDTGEERRRDPAEAVAEEVTGVKYIIPAEGYEAPILMHPSAFAYYPAGPGVEVRHLGGFFDHPGPDADVRISMVRITEKGTFRLSADRAQLIWSVSDGLWVEEKAYPALTCIFSPRDEVVEVSGADEVELYVIEFPRLD